MSKITHIEGSIVFDTKIENTLPPEIATRYGFLGPHPSSVDGYVLYRAPILIDTTVKKGFRFVNDALEYLLGDRFTDDIYPEVFAAYDYLDTLSTIFGSEWRITIDGYEHVSHQVSLSDLRTICFALASNDALLVACLKRGLPLSHYLLVRSGDSSLCTVIDNARMVAHNLTHSGEDVDGHFNKLTSNEALSDVLNDPELKEALGVSDLGGLYLSILEQKVAKGKAEYLGSNRYIVFND